MFSSRDLKIDSPYFRADYLFVVGHYSIFSIASSGNVKCLLDRLDPLLRRYQVSAYFSSHDNNIQVYIDVVWREL